VLLCVIGNSIPITQSSFDIRHIPQGRHLSPKAAQTDPDQNQPGKYRGPAKTHQAFSALSALSRPYAGLPRVAARTRPSGTNPAAFN
jgi:hypothetical protein